MRHLFFVDSEPFLSEGTAGTERRQPFRSSWLLALALVTAIAASSAAVLAM